MNQPFTTLYPQYMFTPPQVEPANPCLGIEILNEAGAVKFDQGKTDWAILPIGASEEIIKVFKFGETKYSRGNYLEGNGLEYSRVLNSLLRHIHAFMRGEDLDPETGISHMAHAGCNIYMLLTYELNKQKFNNDDRAEKIIA